MSVLVSASVEVDHGQSYARSARAHAGRLTVIPGGVNSNVRLSGKPLPLTFSRAKGSRIWDVDGNEYVDYAMGMGPHILGHSPEVVVSAVKRSLDRGQLFAGQVEEEEHLARILVDTFDWVDQVRFGQSGSEMDLLAVRIARAATRRQRVVRFVGHYHGWLDPLLVNPRANSVVPDGLTPGQSEAAASDLLLCPWNDLDALTALVEEHGDTIACILMEPLMCNTGTIQAGPGYLEGVRSLCTEHGIVFVVDEVITGFRLGLTGFQGTGPVHGDLTVYAKAIASGYPLAVLGGRADLMELVHTGGVNHSGTYNSGVVQMAAGLATVRHLIEADPYPAIWRTGAALRDGLNALSVEEGADLVCEGPGPMLQLRFGPAGGVVDAESYFARSDAGRLGEFLTRLQALGVRPTSRGLMFLSASHNDADVESTVAAARQALREMAG